MTTNISKKRKVCQRPLATLQSIIHIVSAACEAHVCSPSSSKDLCLNRAFVPARSS